MRINLCKEIVAVMIVSTLGISGLTGCKSEDPKAVYEEAQQKNIALDSIDMDMNMILDISMNNGEAIIINSKSSNKFSGLADKTDILMEMKTAYSYEDGAEEETNDDTQAADEVTMNYYYADGYYYMDMIGQKSKYSMSMDEIIKQVESFIQIDDLQSDTLEDLSMDKDGNNKVLSYKLNQEEAANLTDSIQGQMKTLLGNADVNIAMESGNGTTTINEEGYITAQSVKMVCKASVDTEEMTLGVDMNIVINNPGQNIIVEKPVDADYAEIK